MADGEEVPRLHASSLTEKIRHASTSRILFIDKEILDRIVAWRIKTNEFCPMGKQSESIYRITDFFGCWESRSVKPRLSSHRYPKRGIMTDCGAYCMPQSEN